MNRNLSPKIKFDFFEEIINEKRIVVLRIESANDVPTSFNGERYIRIGSSKASMKDNPKLEKALFKVLENGSGNLNNKIELTALLDGEPISDKDETDTPVEIPKTPEKDHPKEPGQEEKETEDTRTVEYQPHVNTGDMTNPVVWLGIAGAAGSVCLAVRKQKKK